MVDSGHERSPFAQDVFTPVVANLQKLSEIEKKSFADTCSVLSDTHSQT